MLAGSIEQVSAPLSEQDGNAPALPQSGPPDCRPLGGDLAASKRRQPAQSPKVEKPAMDPKVLHCPLMSAAEMAAITVPFAEAEARLQTVLDAHGVAVVSDVVSAEECQLLEALFCQDLRNVLDDAALQAAGAEVQTAAMAALEDPRCWPEASMDALGDKGSSHRCQLRGLPHGRFAWEARLQPRVRRAYEILHGTSELVSSCDNSFFVSSFAQAADSNRSWPHVDQNKHDETVTDAEGRFMRDWDVYQGILYVWPSTQECSSTTVVWTGSHTGVYEELMRPRHIVKRGQKGRHFTSFDVAKATSLIPQWQENARRVPVPAGGLLLWSSRTVHQGWTGGPRLAQPVCWEPVSRRTEASRERKLRLAALGLPSTHWASLGIPHELVVKEKARLAPAVSAHVEGPRVRLPMVSTMLPVTLADGVPVQAMWEQLSEADWFEPLPSSLKELVEHSVAERYRDVL